MGKIIFIVIWLFFILRYNSKKKGLISPSSFLISIYLISSVFCALDVIINDQPYVLADKYWAGAIVFVILISLFFYPFIRVDETKWEQIIIPSTRLLNLFSTIIIILSIFSMFYYIVDVINVFTSGDLARMREQMNGNEGEYNKGGVLNTIASVSSSFYDIALLLFFIYTAIGGYKKRRMLLLLSSFSYTIQVLTFVGRDGAVYWLFSFIFDYLLFKGFLSNDTKKSIKKLFIKVGIIISIPFLAISVSRFGSSDEGTGGGLISYIGQPISHWCLYYGLDNDRYSSPGSGFPLFYEITGKKQPEGAGLWEADGTASWNFGTFLKSWHRSVGMTGIIIILIFMWIVFLGAFNRRSNKIYFHKFFIYLLFFEIISQGVFYFRQYTRGGNLSILLMFAFYFLFSILENSHKSILYNNKKSTNDHLKYTASQE